MTKLSPAQKAMNNLAFEIQRLPIGPNRLEIEEAHSRLEDTIGTMPEAAAIAAYRALRGQVTAARFEVAKADLATLKNELGKFVALITWNRSPWGERYTKWSRGPAGWTTVQTFFAEASAIAKALDREIESARPIRRSRSHGRR